MRLARREDCRACRWTATSRCSAHSARTHSSCTRSSRGRLPSRPGTGNRPRPSQTSRVTVSGRLRDGGDPVHGEGTRGVTPLVVRRTWPPSTRSGLTMRSTTVPSLPTYPMHQLLACLRSLAEHRDHVGGRDALVPLGRAGRRSGRRRGSRRRRRRCGPTARTPAAGVRRRRERAPGTRQDGPTRTVPSTASTTGASAAARGSAGAACRAVRRRPPRSARSGAAAAIGAGGVHQLGQRGLVVAAQERLGMPGSQGAEPARHVVDQVGQRLRDRRTRRRGDEVVHLGRRPAGVEGPSYRRGGEAVDGRAAARLDVRDERELARAAPARAGRARSR